MLSLPIALTAHTWKTQHAIRRAQISAVLSLLIFDTADVNEVLYVLGSEVGAASQGVFFNIL